MITKRTINIPIFNQSVIILLGDKNEIITYLQDSYGTDQLNDLLDKGFIAACCNYNGLPHIVLDEKDFQFGHFLHELAHSVYCILNWVGVDIHDEEVFCYLYQYLYEECKDILPIRMVVASKTENPADEQVSS